MITRFDAKGSTVFYHLTCMFKEWYYDILEQSAKFEKYSNCNTTEVYDRAFNILTLIFKHTTCFSINLIQDAAFFMVRWNLYCNGGQHASIIWIAFA